MATLGIEQLREKFYVGERQSHKLGIQVTDLWLTSSNYDTSIARQEEQQKQRNREQQDDPDKSAASPALGHV